MKVERMVGGRTEWEWECQERKGKTDGSEGRPSRRKAKSDDWSSARGVYSVDRADVARNQNAAQQRVCVGWGARPPLAEEKIDNRKPILRAKSRFGT